MDGEEGSGINSQLVGGVRLAFSCSLLAPWGALFFIAGGRDVWVVVRNRSVSVVTVLSHPSR